MASLQKVLQLCETFRFVTPVLADQGASGVVSYLKLGPAGELLRHNILNEWVLSSVVTPEENIFMCRTGSPQGAWTDTCFTPEFMEQYGHVKALSGGQLPFGVAETRRRPVPEGGARATTQEATCFEPCCSVELRLRLFVAPSDSAQRFHRWQRLRKMWWRKFSASPGRFSLTDVRSSESANTVHIQASYPWGPLALETVTLCTDISEDDPSARGVLEGKDGRRKALPHMVECVTVLERALMAFLCDGYDEVQHQAMRLHRKLAPYKVALAAAPSSGEELARLAVHTGRQLRRSGLCVLLLPDAASKPLEAQFARNDALGVPYTIVLNAASLKTGIVSLRSRDTTLKEQVHICELKTYVERIFKNY